MKTVGNAYEFNRLLSSFGVPKDHRPTIKIPSLPAYLREPMPAAAPVEVERVPLEAYGIWPDGPSYHLRSLHNA